MHEPTAQADLAAAATVDAAIAVHRALGPGLRESHYRDALVLELHERGRHVEREVKIPIFYKGKRVGRHFQLDIRVDRVLVVELKAKPMLAAGDRYQAMSYLAATGHELGLVLNFGAPRMKDGIKRIVRTSEAR